MPTLFDTALDACNASEENEAAAVKDWLGNSTNKVEEYKDIKMLLVASEKGYPKVVQKLLEDKEWKTELRSCS